MESCYIDSLLKLIFFSLHGLASRFQNTLSRIINRSSKYKPVRPQLKALHWLPIEFRIKFKLSVLMYKVIHSGYPRYLSSYLVPYTSLANTRRSSAEKQYLSQPFCPRNFKLSQYKLGFSYFAPRLWNDLPILVRTSPSVTSFRSRLKRHLFLLAYPP